MCGGGAAAQEGLSDDEAALGNSAFWGAFTVGRVLGVSHTACCCSARQGWWERGPQAGW